MKAIYKLPLKKPVEIEDRWAISVLDGGEFQFQLKEEKVTHFVISFTNQPIEHGFRRAGGYKEGENIAITWKDPRRLEMQKYFSRVLAFLQCDYDIDADVEEIECWYAAESDEEKQHLDNDLHGLAFSRRPEKEIIYVDHKSIGAAVFAAEGEEAPFLAADLIGMARRALNGGRYIDSFRYSFLLIEFLFGKGKFKTAALKASFKSSDELRSAVDRALSDPMLLQGIESQGVQSKINALQTFDAVVNYLVDERGLYFHGNQTGPNAWTSDQQKSAEPVCRLAMAIVKVITYDEIKNIFSNDNWKRYEDNGIAGGAILPTRIVFKGLDTEEQTKKTYVTENDFWQLNHPQNTL